MAVINLRVPDEVLERIDREAEVEGLTRTGLLLRPFVGEDGGGAAPKKSAPKAQVQAAPKSRGAVKGFNAITGEKIYR